MEIPGPDAWQRLAKEPNAQWHARAELFKGELVRAEHKPKFKLEHDERVFCIGSCFARNIEEQLIYQGFDVLSKKIISPAEEWPGRINGFVNKFTTHSMKNELEWVLNPPQFDKSHFTESEGGWRDLQLSPGVKQVSLERAIERREYITHEYFARIREATVVVLTLGLNEVWYDSLIDRFLNAPPSFFSVRRSPSRYSLHITDVMTNIEELEKIYATLRSINDRLRIVVTVSPVPMAETFSGKDVLVANSLSKSTLRAAAESFATKHSNVDYFPSYEMVSLSERGSAYAADCMHVTDHVVSKIMQEFIRTFIGVETCSVAFSEIAYLAANPDVEANVRLGTYSSGYEHWLSLGRAEGRQLSPPSGPTPLMIATGAV